MFQTVAAALIFPLVEIAIILRHPVLYWRSVERAVGQGRYPFHAYPRALDEKFLWRKIFDRDPTFTRISDKLQVREWLRESGIDVQMTPVLWSGVSADDIPEAYFSGDVIAKANHDSGSGIAMWHNPVPRHEAVERLNVALARDFGRLFGEWGYVDVPRKVFVEKRIGRDGVPLNDLKFYTFGRRIERLVHIQDRPDGRFGQVFVADGKDGLRRLERAPSVCKGRLEEDLTGFLAEAVEHARELGAPFDHMRVDLIESGGTLWLGELTIYNQRGHLADGGGDPGSRISRAWDLRSSRALRELPGGFLRRSYLRLLRDVLNRKAT